MRHGNDCGVTRCRTFPDSNAETRTWVKVVVLEARLRYRILEPSHEDDRERICRGQTAAKASIARRARSACPRWLSASLRSGDSSAAVHPVAGSRKSGS